MSNEATKTVEDPAISLGLLEQIETNSAVTQRVLSNELGIALGLVNLYLKRCIKKGWIKATQAPANRYAYYLTPRGFQEKSRLTAEYLSSSLHFFRNARHQMNDLFEECAARDMTRLILDGAGDLAEIAVLAAHDIEAVEVVGILDAGRAGEKMLGLRIEADIAVFGAIDGAVITTMTAPQEQFDEMRALLGAERVFAPRMLRISEQPMPTDIKAVVQEGA